MTYDKQYGDEATCSPGERRYRSIVRNGGRTYNGQLIPPCRRIAGDLLSAECFCGACEPDDFDDFADQLGEAFGL